MSKVPVYIHRDLYDKIKRLVQKNRDEFESVEEYVTFVLQEVLKEEPKETYTTEEKEEVKERLRRLGYI